MAIHMFNYVCDDCNDKVIGVTFEEFNWHRKGMFLKCLCRGKNEREIVVINGFAKDKLTHGTSYDKTNEPTDGAKVS